MKELIEPYRVYYEKYNEEFQLACDCIKSNPSFELSNAINDLLKNVLEPLYNLDWNDSAKEVFDESLKYSHSELTSIIQSIDSDFSKAENIQIEINNLLNDLQSKTLEYDLLLQKIPDREDYKKEIRDSQGILRGVSYFGYQEAYDDWKEKCIKKIDECEEIVSEIENLFVELDIIDGINLNTGLEQKMFDMQYRKLQKANNLVSYKFNNSNFLIIDTDASYESILKNIGDQGPDQCLQYSLKYSRSIFKNSESVALSTTGTETNGIVSKNPDDILRIAANEILDGRPCIIQVNGLVKDKKNNKCTRHFVAVTGIKEDYDINNLKESDFLIMDPDYAVLKQLNTDSGEYRERHLISGRDLFTVKDYDYLAVLFNNLDEYVTDEVIHNNRY